MKIVRKKELKVLIKKFTDEIKFISSTTVIHENRHLNKMVRLIKRCDTKEKATVFKVVRSFLSRNVFLFVLLEQITGHRTLKESEAERMDVILNYWKKYQYKF